MLPYFLENLHLMYKHVDMYLCKCENIETMFSRQRAVFFRSFTFFVGLLVKHYMYHGQRNMFRPAMIKANAAEIDDAHHMEHNLQCVNLVLREREHGNILVEMRPHISKHGYHTRTSYTNDFRSNCDWLHTGVLWGRMYVLWNCPLDLSELATIDVSWAGMLCRSLFEIVVPLMSTNSLSCLLKACDHIVSTSCLAVPLSENAWRILTKVSRSCGADLPQDRYEGHHFFTELLFSFDLILCESAIQAFKGLPRSFSLGFLEFASPETTTPWLGMRVAVSFCKYSGGLAARSLQALTIKNWLISGWFACLHAQGIPRNFPGDCTDCYNIYYIHSLNKGNHKRGGAAEGGATSVVVAALLRLCL